MCVAEASWKRILEKNNCMFGQTKVEMNLFKLTYTDTELDVVSLC